MGNSELIRSPQPLHGMFTKVPQRYDLINHVITLGQDTRWRKLAARACLEGNPPHVLDLGCGTGDLAINVARLAKAELEITGLDYSLPMLELAKNKAEKAGLKDKVEFIHGEATKIPFVDEYFDCVGISFAFRNLTYLNPLWELHLAEVLRALKSGGKYVIVESSQPRNRFIKTLFHLYLRAFVMPVGTLLSGEQGAYRYLAESAARYYSPEEVREMLLKAGFREVTYRPLFLGAAGIHVATR
ncbi:MAG: ubiquinone/menaquinone biosynthesis methyltransferase [Dehalococcoidales bacterium]